MKWYIRLLIASCLIPCSAALAETTVKTPYGDATIYKPSGEIASVAPNGGSKKAPMWGLERTA